MYAHGDLFPSPQPPLSSTEERVVYGISFEPHYVKKILLLCITVIVPLVLEVIDFEAMKRFCSCAHDYLEM